MAGQVRKVEEKGVISAEQVASLVRVAKGEWKGLIIGRYYTGARIGDLSNLKWDAVDLERKAILLVQGKTKRPLEVPIHPEFERWLNQTPTVMDLREKLRGGMARVLLPLCSAPD